MGTNRLLIAFAAIACAAALALVALDPRAALTGWMGAAVAFAAIPAGAICLQAMMKLIPGAWGEALQLSTEAAAMLAIPAALAFVPVMLGIGAIYPWESQPPVNAFQAMWLSPGPFVMRTLLWFALLAGSGHLLRRRTSSRTVAVATLLVFPLLGSFVMVDWLLSFTPHYASSGFGLQLLILSVNLAYAVLLLLRLSIGRTPKRIGVLGGLLLTLLLMWAYIQFLTFFIAWSPGEPEGAAWFGLRDGWRPAETVFGALGVVPLLMLILPQFRNSAAWLRRLAVAVIAGKAIEFAWFALPGTGAIGIAAYALALLGFGLFTIAGLRLALPRRIAARRPA